MAIAYLLASNEISFNSDNIIFLGELSLHGQVRKISGILPILSKLGDLGYKVAYIPYENIDEAVLIKNLDIFPVDNLSQLIQHFKDKKIISKITDIRLNPVIYNNTEKDMSTVRGNSIAKRGLEIAGAGAHNVVLFGPPGTGKTLLAHCFQSILPDLGYLESIEVTGIHSLLDHARFGLITRPPFRSPHHTASYPAIVGGGAFPKPGEITLAHRGVLFMDEFPEFDSSVIEALRQPLEEQQITISRAKGIVTFPAQTIFIASLNPCPCGMNGSDRCRCTQNSIESYKKKISGPIADRIDLWLNVDKIDYDKLGLITNDEEPSINIRKRVAVAREIQKNRFALHKIDKLYNSEISSTDIEKIIDGKILKCRTKAWLRNKTIQNQQPNQNG
jgi:magnesium chelatase family protein